GPLLAGPWSRRKLDQGNPVLRIQVKDQARFDVADFVCPRAFESSLRPYERSGHRARCQARPYEIHAIRRSYAYYDDASRNKLKLAPPWNFHAILKSPHAARSCGSPGPPHRLSRDGADLRHRGRIPRALPGRGIPHWAHQCRALLSTAEG